jgi:macrolide transport system ATP-binding/permease protein
MLLTIHNLTKSYGAHTVLNAASFVVNEHERIGIVGPNGVGKTTLLRLLTGQEEVDAGTIAYGPAVEAGYLPQTTPEFHGRTIQDLIMAAVGNLRQLEEHMRQLEVAMANATASQLDVLLEEYNAVTTRYQGRGGYEIDYKIDVVMQGLRIAYLSRTQEVDTLSGGEKARLGIATLLLRSPDILLLDEPTNHLDFATMAWLETYLTEYPGAALIVSHDRKFLNQAVNRIFEIDEHNHQLKTYEGNYDAYVQAKAAERLKWEEDYQRQQEEIQELRKRIKEAERDARRNYHAPRDNDKFIKRYYEQSVQRTQARNVRAAQTQLARIEADPIPKPPEILRVSSQFNVEPIHTQEVIQIARVYKSFGERNLFNDLNIVLSAKTRMMLIGPNGTGKTTLLKLIMGQESPDSGHIKTVERAQIGYLPQDPQFADLDRTVIDTYRYGQIGYESEFVGRLIGYGLFRLDDMAKKVGQLSIGQRRKLEIACLLAQKPNALLLDEPTNYISLDVLEAFEAAIHAFPGPVLAISHDRWFIQHFGGEIWELAEGRLIRREDDTMNWL